MHIYIYSTIAQCTLFSLQEQSKAVPLKEVTFSLPKGETTLGELRMAGYVFFIGVNRDTPMLIYKSVYLDGKLGSLGESVAYRRENDDKVKHN